MKKLIFLFALLAIALDGSAQEFQEFEKDGLRYRVMDGEYLRLVKVSDELKGEVVIPDSVYVQDEGCTMPVKVFSRYSFDECDSIYSVVFPSTLEYYYAPVFRYCRSLKKVDMGKTNMTIIPDGFLGVALEELILPPAVEEIGKSAFGAAHFTSIKFPNTLRSIGESAFVGSLLEEVDFGDAPLYVGYTAFQHCRNLKKVKWSKYMNSLYWKSFTDTSISDVVIFKSMEYLYCPFIEMKTLKNVYCFFENPDDLWSRDAFFRADLSDCILWVPEGSEDLYRNHEEWQGFKEVRGFDTANFDSIEMQQPTEAGVKFDLLGREVKNPQPGNLYIEKGKKSIMR